MKSFRYLIVAIAATVCASSSYAEKSINLTSPDGRLTVSVSVADRITYSVLHDGIVLLNPSPVSMSLTNGTVFGKNSHLKKNSVKEFHETIQTAVYKKNTIADNYRELKLDFKEGFSLIFRAYNDGVAYRFISALTKPFEVASEEASFNFTANNKAYIPYVNATNKTLEQQFFNSFENTYSHIPVASFDEKRLAFAPVLIEASEGKKICITEADLLHYPGMYLHKGDTENSLKGVFAPYPKEIEQGGHNMLQGLVKSREAYIAKVEGKTNFPWRVIIVSSEDKDLTNSDMVYRLASSNPEKNDFSWVKPGKVAWDWWNDWNLYNVDFKAGINNETYKYYIDFASKQGIEYVILDEGWAVNRQADLFQIIPEINLKELIAYANSRNVGLILWAGYWAINRDIERVCSHYSEMGIKGFKVDFMDRDDQPIVEFYAEVARVAAKYKLLVDFHGAYKPTGLHRTYPNVINFEGVHGLEQMKWSDASVDQVTYDVTIPFIRMVAGPFDYTQGAMRNATRGNYRPVNSEPMSQGTRCRQLAEYIIFESPLNMLCDNPSNYLAEPECTRFIAEIPTVWDETKAVNGKVAEYITIARRKGNTWYVGSLTNWTPRNLEIDLSFIGQGEFVGEVFRDGANANKAARDYKKETIKIPADRRLKISMASGGGWVIKITGN
ncbi:MAG: glycoside hydrolase family 97 protein [Dysgonamonadaceae bacterium]|jgi:alpha-glucosidase|nr:glycoside hydrolase family 97 protein [Dysgonamonadaceae bacterium]